MKISKLIFVTLFISAFATVSVINIQLAKPKDAAEVTLDMLDVMSRAFDESEGGEGGTWICPPWPQEPEYFNPENQCTGGQVTCMIIFTLNGEWMGTYTWPNHRHTQAYGYQCIPEVIIDP